MKLPENNIVQLATAINRQFEALNRTFVSPALELQKTVLALTKHPLARMTADVQRMHKALKPGLTQEILASQQKFLAAQESQRRLVEQFARSINLPKIEFQLPKLDLRLPRFEMPAGVLDALRQLPARMQRAVVTLARHGWYVDPEMPLPLVWDVARLLADGDEDAERVLIAYYERRTDDIAHDLVTRFPDRAGILMQAFDAHHDGDYALSVLAFLVQADGVCQELTGGVQLYRRRERRPMIAIYLEETRPDGFGRVMLHAFEEPVPLMAYADERATDPDGLNRHEVLHGVSVDYGTRENSLKALSLLWYVASVLDKPVLDEVS